MAQPVKSVGFSFKSLLIDILHIFFVVDSERGEHEDEAAPCGNGAEKQKRPEDALQVVWRISSASRSFFASFNGHILQQQGVVALRVNGERSIKTRDGSVKLA